MDRTECLQEAKDAVRGRREPSLQTMQATVPRLSFRETQPRSLLDRRGRLRVRVIPRSSLSRASFIVLGGFGAWRPTLWTYDSPKLPFKTPSSKLSTTCAQDLQESSAPLPHSHRLTFTLLQISMLIHPRLYRRLSPRAHHWTLGIPSYPLPNQAHQCVSRQVRPLRN